jgi:serine protease Do
MLARIPPRSTDDTALHEENFMSLPDASNRPTEGPNALPSNGSLRFRRHRPGLRNVLLGAVAVVAVAGVVADVNVAFPARADVTTTTAAPGPTVTAPGSFADVVERVKGAVVSVKVKTVEQSAEDDGDMPDLPQLPPGNPLEKFFHQFGQGREFHHPHSGMAQGSGFFISADGYIVTNNHVVENATDVTVTTVDGKTIPATVVGLDKKTDLALLKVKQDGGAPYPFVTFAATQPRVGDWVLAVGNPFGLGGTVTAGIVSARGRDIGSGPYDDFLQIDAPVNRGNSGGPTFNTAGEVVGVNTAIYSPSGGSVGIGFAITADTVKSVVASLEKTGTVSRGWLGVEIQPVTDDIADSLGLKDTKGALVAEAQKSSPALAAGIASGDVITEVNGERVDSPRELARKIAALGPNATAEITYLRGGTPHKVSLKLGNLPDDKQASVAKPETDMDKSSLASLGLELAPASSVAGAGKDGVVVTNVDPDGSGAQRGLKAGDVILEAAGKTVSRPSDVLAAVDEAKKDGRKAVLLRVKSDNGTHFVALAMQKAS